MLKEKKEALAKFMLVIAQISYGSVVITPFMKGEVQTIK
jgi:hypothetical protein